MKPEKHRKSLESDRDDIDLLFRPSALLIRADLIDLLHDRESLRAFAETRVLAVEPIRRHDRDKELRSVRVRTRIRHRDLQTCAQS